MRDKLKQTVFLCESIKYLFFITFRTFCLMTTYYMKMKWKSMTRVRVCLVSESHAHQFSSLLIPTQNLNLCHERDGDDKKIHVKVNADKVKTQEATLKFHSRSYKAIQNDAVNTDSIYPSSVLRT